MIELYSDSFRFSVSPFGVAYSYGLAVPHPDPSKPQPAKEMLILRMSLENSKVLAMLLRKLLSGYEREHGVTIALPHTVFAQLGISEEDWPSNQQFSG